MSGYPADHDIRVRWTWFQRVLVVGSTLVLWLTFWLLIGPDHERIKTTLTLLGLNIDIVGVVWASLTAPYFGAFADGGAVEHKRRRVQERAFQIGMCMVGVGFLLQGLATIL